MKRLHLFEFEDQRWFPTSLRNYMTDFLQVVSAKFNFYRLVVPLIIEALRQAQTSTMIDIASGAGGPMVKIAPLVKSEIPDLRIRLTDYYPNLAAFKLLVERSPEVFSFDSRAINALDIPPDLIGLRTQFLSFHHFAPVDAQRILENAVKSRMPVAIFEAQRRDATHLAKFIFSPILVLLVTPFIRPLRIGRFFFTYFIPLVPLLIGWDGIVSVLRTYTIDEMRHMTGSIPGGDEFCWEIGESNDGPLTVLYLVGYPVK